MAILMFNLYAYYKRGTNKQDLKSMGTPSALKKQANLLMNDSNVSVIVIENPQNNHRFKWDPSMDNKWRELSKPQDSQMAKLPILTGTLLVTNLSLK